MRLNIILFTLAAKPETYWEISHQVKRKTCGQSNINLANLPLGFPESVHLIHMCETCFVFSKESLKASRFKFTVFFFLLSTGSTQRLAEHHPAGKLSFTICPSEEADRNLKWRNNPERYQPVQRRTLVATAGAHLTLIYLCVLFNIPLLWQQWVASSSD